MKRSWLRHSLLDKAEGEATSTFDKEAAGLPEAIRAQFCPGDMPGLQSVRPETRAVGLVSRPQRFCELQREDSPVVNDLGHTNWKGCVDYGIATQTE